MMKKDKRISYQHDVSEGTLTVTFRDIPKGAVDTFYDALCDFAAAIGEAYHAGAEAQKKNERLSAPIPPFPTHAPVTDPVPCIQIANDPAFKDIIYDGPISDVNLTSFGKPLCARVYAVGGGGGGFCEASHFVRGIKK